MFTPSSRSGYDEARPGVRFRTLAHGARTLLAEFHLGKGASLPRHAHPHEQTGYLVGGALRFTIAGARFDARPGDGWCIEGGVEHEVVAVEDSVVVEVFCPVRGDLLPAGGSA